MISNAPPNLVLVGVDWADKLHAFHLLDSDQNTEQGTFEQDPKRIDELIKQWRNCYPGTTFAIAIEQSKGPLISALLRWTSWLSLDHFEGSSGQSICQIVSRQGSAEFTRWIPAS